MNDTTNAGGAFIGQFGISRLPYLILENKIMILGFKVVKQYDYSLALKSLNSMRNLC